MHLTDLLHPFWRRMMRRMRSAGCVVNEERLVGLDLIQHLDIVDRLIRHGGNQVPAGMANIRLYWSGVAEEIAGRPLGGVVADETVVVLEALDGTCRPVVEGAGLARRPQWHVVVLTEPRGAVAVLSQHLADCDTIARNDAVVAGITRRHIHD